MFRGKVDDQSVERVDDVRLVRFSVGDVSVMVSWVETFFAVACCGGGTHRVTPCTRHASMMLKEIMMLL